MTNNDCPPPLESQISTMQFAGCHSEDDVTLSYGVFCVASVVLAACSMLSATIPFSESQKG